MDYSNLKRILKVKKISQAELAKALNFTDAGFNRAIKNDSLKVRDLEKIADFLNVPVENLLTKQYNDNESFFLNQGGNQSVGNKVTGNHVQESGDASNTKNENEMLQMQVIYLKSEIQNLKEIIKLKDELLKLSRK